MPIFDLILISWNERKRAPVLTVAFASVMILLFVLYQTQLFQIEDLAFSPLNVFDRPWILLTSIFFHRDLLHLVANLLFFLTAGIYIECGTRVKRIHFLFVFLISSIIADSVFMLIKPEGLWGSWGASASIWALFGLLIIIKSPYKIYVGATIGLWALFQIPWYGLTGVLHLTGFIVGTTYGYSWKKREPSSWRYP